MCKDKGNACKEDSETKRMNTVCIYRDTFLQETLKKSPTPVWVHSFLPVRYKASRKKEKLGKKSNVQ